MNPKVAVVILNWDGWSDTVECLDSLYTISYPCYTVVVVDNHSTDESVDKIREYCQGEKKINSELKDNDNFNSIKIFEYGEDYTNLSENLNEINDLLPSEKLVFLRNKENYGFAGGNNVGISFALDVILADYVLLLNNDTVVDPDFLTEMVNLAESDDKIGFVGPKTYFYNKKDTIQAAGGGNIDFTHGVAVELAFNHQYQGDFNFNCELEYIGGSCLLVKKEVIEKIGLLKKEYFMYWEDVEWCFRGREYGYKSFYAYKSNIWHKYGTSSLTSFKIYYLNRSRLYFIKEHAQLNQKASFFLYFFLYRFWFECIDYYFQEKDKDKFKSLTKGVWDGLKGP
jgi:GT2 family glycosyltransferase